MVAADKGEEPTMMSTVVGVGSMGQQQEEEIIGAVKGMEVWDLLVLPDKVHIILVRF